jgi:hypothetical protein
MRGRVSNIAFKMSADGVISRSTRCSTLIHSSGLDLHGALPGGVSRAHHSLLYAEVWDYAAWFVEPIGTAAPQLASVSACHIWSLRATRQGIPGTVLPQSSRSDSPIITHFVGSTLRVSMASWKIGGSGFIADLVGQDDRVQRGGNLPPLDRSADVDRDVGDDRQAQLCA